MIYYDIAHRHTCQQLQSEIPVTLCLGLTGDDCIITCISFYLALDVYIIYHSIQAQKMEQSRAPCRNPSRECHIDKEFLCGKCG